MESKHRQPNETTAQWRGRIKRETNAANDALGLKEGEPILLGRIMKRFHPRMIDRVRPTQMTRLEGESLVSFLEFEKGRREHQERIEKLQAERDAFSALPHVQDADAIRYFLEDRLKDIIDRLTPAEWADLRKKLEP